jgi:hypothetical protein
MQHRSSEVSLEELPWLVIVKIFLLLTPVRLKQNSASASFNRDSGALSCTSRLIHEMILLATHHELIGRYFWAGVPAMRQLYQRADVIPIFYTLNARLNLLSEYLDESISQHDLFCLTGQINLIQQVIDTNLDTSAYHWNHCLFFIALSENGEALSHFYQSHNLTTIDILPETKTQLNLQMFICCMLMFGTRGAWAAAAKIIPDMNQKVGEFIKLNKALGFVEKRIRSGKLITRETLECLLEFCSADSKESLDELCNAIVYLKRFDLFSIFIRFAKVHLDYQLPEYAFSYWFSIGNPEKIEELISRNDEFKQAIYADNFKIGIRILLQFNAYAQPPIPLTDFLVKLLKRVIAHLPTATLSLFITQLVEHNQLLILKKAVCFPSVLAMIHADDSALGHELLTAAFTYSAKRPQTSIDMLMYILNELKINPHTKHNINKPLLFKAAVAASSLLNEYLKYTPNVNIRNAKGYTAAQAIYIAARRTHRHDCSDNLFKNLTALVKAGMNPAYLIGESGCTNKSFYDWGLSPFSSCGVSGFDEFLTAAIEAGLDIYQKDDNNVSLLAAINSNVDICTRYKPETIKLILKGNGDENALRPSFLNDIFKSLCIHGNEELITLLLSNWKNVNIFDECRLRPAVLREFLINEIQLATFNALFAGNNNSPNNFTGLDIAVLANNIEAVRVIIKFLPAQTVIDLISTKRLFKKTMTTYEMAVAMNNEQVVTLLTEFLNQTPQATTMIIPMRKQ